MSYKPGRLIAHAREKCKCQGDRWYLHRHAAVYENPPTSQAELLEFLIRRNKRLIRGRKA